MMKTTIHGIATHTTYKEQNKMRFLMNALDEGWSIKKRNDQYVMTKRHKNRREVFEEEFLENFVVQMATTP
jgi:hypothetical protein